MTSFWDDFSQKYMDDKQHTAVSAMGRSTAKAYFSCTHGSFSLYLMEDGGGGQAVILDCWVVLCNKNSAANILLSYQGLEIDLLASSR